MSCVFESNDQCFRLSRDKYFLDLCGYPPYSCIVKSGMVVDKKWENCAQYTKQNWLTDNDWNIK